MMLRRVGLDMTSLTLSAREMDLEIFVRVAVELLEVVFMAMTMELVYAFGSRYVQ